MLGSELKKSLYAVVVLLLGIPVVGMGQGIVASQAGSVNSATSATRQIARVDLKNVALSDALDELSKLSGVAINYSRDMIPARHRVNYSAINVSLDTALGAVLKGTALTYMVSSSGKIHVVQRGNVKNSVQGVIAGRVTDVKTGNGISGANVSLDIDTRGVVTDETGTYRLSGVAVGTRTVTVRLVGYAKQTRQIAVGEGATITVDFRLEPSANVLDQVVVTGTVVQSELRSVPNAITVITAKQIEERGVTRIDQLFRGDVPGLFSLELGTGSPGNQAASLNEVVMFSRGTTKISNVVNDASSITNPIKTYIDGVEMSDSRYLSQIDPKSIERIEILPGPQASTIYGAGAINGVMQIFTKRGNTIKPSLSLDLSEGFIQNSFSSAVASSHRIDGSISGTEGNTSYNVGSGWDYTGSWAPGKQLQRTSIYGGSRYQLKVISLDFSARKGWTENRLRGNNGQVNTIQSSTGKFLTDVYTGLASPLNRFLYGRTLGATLGFTPFTWWSHRINVGDDVSDTEAIVLEPRFTSLNDTARSIGQSLAHRASQSYSSTLTIHPTSLLQASFTYGADHWRNRTATINQSVQLSGQVTPSFVSLSKVTSTKNMGMYIQSQFGFGDILFLTYGIRADWNPNYGNQAKVRPGRYGLSLARDLDFISVKLRGSYGRSIRPPADGQMQGAPILPITSSTAAQLAVFGSPIYSVLPSPQLGPEFQQGGEGGIELYLGNRGSLVVTRYNQTIDGLISNIAKVDSISALLPGVTTFGGSGCTIASDLRSDGYCYLVQSQNLNVGSIRNQGWELQGSANIGPFTTNGTYSWTKSRVIGITPRYRSLLTDQAFIPGQTFNWIPEHTWAMNLSYSRNATLVSFNINGLGQTFRNASVGDLALVASTDLRLRAQESYRMSAISIVRQSLAGYTTSNLNMSHHVSKVMEATLQINNITNYYHNDFNYSLPTIGRQTRLGFRWRVN